MFPSLERRATTSTQPHAAWGRACRQRKLDAGTAVKIRDLTRRGDCLTLRLGVLNVTSHDIFNDVLEVAHGFGEERAEAAQRRQSQP
jgi:hypothetical protein